MHWIEEFRLNCRGANGKRGIDRGELAAMVRRRGTGCSPKLIEILEAGGATIPVIADKIALVCGATDAQYDEIVLDKYKGKRIRRRSRRPPQKEKYLSPNATAVVAFDTMGIELERYESINAAAREAGVDAPVVAVRCQHKIVGDEFKTAKRSWRYAEEWDKMSAAQRLDTAIAAKERGCKA